MRSRGRFALIVALGLGLAACQTVPGSNRDFAAAEAVLDDHIRTLSSADFSGREPGTEGGRKTQQYLVDALASYGFVGGVAEDDWRQEVEIVRYTPGPSKVTLVVGDATQGASGDLIVVSGAPQALDDIPMIPVAEASEVSDGSLANQAALVQVANARALFSAVSAADPEAIVLQAATEEEFKQFTGFLSRGRWQLKDANGTSTPIVLLSPEAAKLLTGDDLPLSISIESNPSTESANTANVIGKLRGKVPGSGAVMILAHWDHLGQCGPADAEDRLCNGAVDNASGLGVMLETARRVAASGGLDRDLYVMGTTAEELGLLGAEAFAQNPPFPLPTIVAAFNIDTVAIAPRGASTTVVGWGRTPLDEGIQQVVESIGGTFKVDPYTEQFVRRQDGWALLSRDVPTVLVSTSFGDEEAFNAFLNGPYHGVDDEWSEDMELGGATTDIFTHVALLKHFGNVATYQPGERTEGGAARGAVDE